MAKGLTRRQADILQFIVDTIREERIPPTIAEVGQQFGISSTNGVNDHLVALEKKGYIERSSKARSIRLTEKAAASMYESPVPMIPLLGHIAAGTPILAEENVEDRLPIAPSLARDASYCLRVRGDSMIEDGIFDGDVIVVAQSDRPSPGDIVVALVEDEATVKHFHPHGEMVELRPANASMDPLLVPAKSLQIQGVVVALQRTIR
jgi:repressor LexA